MGMYDDVICKYKLPLPEDASDYLENNPEGHFQTKDLDCFLNRYEIREDGSFWIYKAEVEYVPGDKSSKSFLDRVGSVKEKKSWWEPVDINGNIEIYDYIHGKNEYDYSIQYSIMFVGGKVTKAELYSFQKFDNTQRKINDKIFKEKLKLRNKFVNTRRYKYFYRYYNKVLRFVHDNLSKALLKTESLLQDIYYYLKV